ncbi:hypothetical protein DBY21_00925 [Candidatus Gastranaerophilales bacterium]|nr:MAG: hypothetical protein DBY21_00925 [Candidatus Gastranaerophilales bacterium]
MKKNKKVFVIIVAIIILLLLCIIIPEQYRKIQYGGFKTIGLLKRARSNHKSILIDKFILTYGGEKIPGMKYDSIETYDIQANKSEMLSNDIAKRLELTNLDIVKVWNDYLIIYRKGMHSKNIEATLSYYNFKNKKFERIIKPKYDDYYADFFVLSNGDVVLYTNKNSEKYSYANNNFVKLIPQTEKKEHELNLFYNIPTIVALNKDSFLLISTSSANVYENDTFKPVEKIQFNVGDFSNFYHIGEQAPKFIALDNGKFAVFSYDKKTHLNKIRIYEYKNSKIELISTYETKRIWHALSSGRILKIKNDEIVILGGKYGIPSILMFNTGQCYIFNIKENRLYRISSLKNDNDTFSSVIYSEKIYMIGGYQNEYKKEIDVLELNR